MPHDRGRRRRRPSSGHDWDRHRDGYERGHRPVYQAVESERRQIGPRAPDTRWEQSRPHVRDEKWITQSYPPIQDSHGSPYRSIPPHPLPQFSPTVSMPIAPRRHPSALPRRLIGQTRAPVNEPPFTSRPPAIPAHAVRVPSVASAPAVRALPVSELVPDARMSDGYVEINPTCSSSDLLQSTLLSFDTNLAAVPPSRLPSSHLLWALCLSPAPTSPPSKVSSLVSPSPPASSPRTPPLHQYSLPSPRATLLEDTPGSSLPTLDAATQDQKVTVMKELIKHRDDELADKKATIAAMAKRLSHITSKSQDAARDAKNAEIVKDATIAALTLQLHDKDAEIAALQSQDVKPDISKLAFVDEIARLRERLARVTFQNNNWKALAEVWEDWGQAHFPSDHEHEYRSPTSFCSGVIKKEANAFGYLVATPWGVWENVGGDWVGYEQEASADEDNHNSREASANADEETRKNPAARAKDNTVPRKYVAKAPHYSRPASAMDNTGPRQDVAKAPRSSTTSPALHQRSRKSGNANKRSVSQPRPSEVLYAEEDMFLPSGKRKKTWIGAALVPPDDPIDTQLQAAPDVQGTVFAKQNGVVIRRSSRWCK